jgi:Subtilase family/Secretion system C-terminal sorting domain
MKKILWGFIGLWAGVSMLSAEPFVVVFKKQLNLVEMNRSWDEKHVSSEERTKELLRQAFQLQKAEKIRWEQFVSTQSWRGQVQTKHFFFITNAIWVDLPHEAISSLQRNAHVAEVIPENQLQLGVQLPVVETPSPEAINGTESGLRAVGAPFMWNLGYTGRGRKALVYDTGFWDDHPAVKSRFLARYFPYQRSWRSFDLKFPGDKQNSHGTHVSGTIAGLDPANRDTIGMAMNAYLMHTDPIVSDLADVKNWPLIMQGYEWAINPDRDTATINDIPDAINNSWGRSGLADSTFCGLTLLTQTFRFVEAAGIANIYSAGNNGPGPSTVGAPQEIALDKTLPFTVGALDGNTTGYPIASFSSRGPTGCPISPNDSSILIRPEVTAPGFSVRSSIGHAQYSNYNGTSMASPHVTGAVMLLKEAFPMCTGKQILEALYYSAADLGAPGEDNVFGNGIINLPNAYQYLSTRFTPVPALSRHYDIAMGTVSNIPSAHALYCSNSVSPTIQMKNLGDSVIQVVDVLIYQGDSVIQTIPVNQTIAVGTSVPFSLSGIPSQWGLNELTLALRSNQNEWDTINNRFTFRFHRLKNQTLPFKEDFEGKNIYTQSSSCMVNPDRDLSWDTIPVGGSPRGTTAAYVRNNRYVTGLNQFDGMVFGSFDFPAGSPAYLYFRYSYRYSLPSRSDSLRVKFSEDCGQTWQYVAFDNGGVPLSSGRGGNFRPDSAHHWRDTTLNVSVLAGKSNVYMMFENKSQQMGNLYVDDIVLDRQMITSSSNIFSNPWFFYPNPSTGIIHIEAEENDQFCIIDLQGRSVARFSMMTATQTFSVEHLPKGVYLLERKFKGGVSVKKMVIQ